MHSIISIAKIKTGIFLFALLCALELSSQTVVINELSNGASGSEEYVELLVVGNPTCAGIPTLDMRGYYLDDNNGAFAAGSGVGIAGGCMRLTTATLWQAVPIGTLIVIYNSDDVNGNIPAQDVSLTDGNCRLVIPSGNCTLLQHHTSTPSTSSSTYPTTGFSSCGDWGPTSLLNAGDSYQVRDASGNLLHAVSYGNNTSASVIYFSGAGGGKVYRMMNNSNNNPSLQANWTSANTAGNESPGSPNNPANAAWINSMNNSCSPITPLSLNVSSTSAGCTCNGSASVTASGGIAPYTYSWSGSAQTTATMSNACQGTYTVTVTDNRGCSETATVSISAASGLTVTVTPTNVNCNGSANGSATASVSGGTVPFTYSWSSGGSSATENNLAAGIYTVTVSDNNSCTATETVNIAEPVALTSSVVSADPKCAGSNDGSATLTVSGGTGLYTYTWLPSGGPGAGSSNLSANLYTVEVRDANNCLTTETFTLTDPAVLDATSSSTDATCGNANGTASVSATGGTGSYTYLWSTGSTSSSITSLAPGNYPVTITDNNLCSFSTTVTVNGGTAPALSGSHTDVSCNGLNDGTATVSVSGGSGTISYLWAPGGATSPSVSSLSPGTYTCTVTDAVNCTATASFIISEPVLLSAGLGSTDVKCFGGSDGTATLITSGGTGAYSYHWLPSGGSASSNSNLSAGSYTVEITDVNNCLITKNFTIAEPTALNVTGFTTNESCNQLNGTSSLTVSGGIPGYTYLWSNGATTAVVNGLAAGIYTVTVTDQNLCTSISLHAVGSIDGPSVNITHADISCNGADDGTATAVVSGGTGGYSYLWQPSGSTTAVISNLSAGTYTVSVSDDLGCLTNSTVSINEPLPILVTLNNGTICSGQSFTITAVASGGQQPYSYAWSTGATGSTTIVVSPAVTTTYSLQVTDNAGCSSGPITTTIQVNDPLSLDAVINDTICTGNTGQLTAVAHGGNGNYTYTWMPGSITGQSITPAPTITTTYTVSVTDGCTTGTPQQTADIVLFAFPTITFTADTLTGCIPVCVNFQNTTLINSSAIASLSWNFGDHASSSLSAPQYCYTSAGEFTPSLTITSIDGCVVTGTAPYSIDVLAQPIASFVTSATELTLEEPQALLSNTSQNYSSLQWISSTGQVFSNENINLNFETEGDFPVSLVATNSIGCSDTSTLVISVKPAFTFYIPNAFTPDGDNFNTSFAPKGMGWSEKNYSFEIYNRWGQKIFSTENINDSWNGTLNGKPVQMDTYIWNINVSDSYLNPYHYSGIVNLIR